MLFFLDKEIFVYSLRRSLGLNFDNKKWHTRKMEKTTTFGLRKITALSNFN